MGKHINLSLDESDPNHTLPYCNWDKILTCKNSKPRRKILLSDSVLYMF